jgi:hypothetical protein
MPTFANLVIMIANAGGGMHADPSAEIELIRDEPKREEGRKIAD